MALRDEEWGTVAGSLSDYEISARRRRVRGLVRDDPPPAAGVIHLDGAGSRETGPARSAIELDGVAETAFRYCRIGFCLLHPPRSAPGRTTAAARRRVRSRERCRSTIGPQRFERRRRTGRCLNPSASSSCRLASGLEVQLLFEGDLFETEDQRNWTDASFKTYCTPQELGYPFDARRRSAVSQKVTIQVVRPGRGQRAGARSFHRVACRHSTGAAAAPADRLGAATRASIAIPTASSALLARAQPDHLRVDLDLARDGWSARLAGAARDRRARSAARSRSPPSRRAPASSTNWSSELAALPVARLLVFALRARDVDPAMTGHARERIAERGFRLPVIGGTDLWFAELNRDRPDVSAMDGLVYSITPQVHTFDEESIAQSLEAQPDTVTDRDRRSPAACRSWSARSPCGRASRSSTTQPPTDSARHAAVLGRSPPVVTVRRGLDGGQHRGARGGGCREPDVLRDGGLARHHPGRPAAARSCSSARLRVERIAMFHVFADVLRAGRGDEAPRCPLARADSKLAALALRSGDALRVLIANLTPAPLTVELDRGLAARWRSQFGCSTRRPRTRRSSIRSPTGRGRRAPLTSAERAAHWTWRHSRSRGSTPGRRWVVALTMTRLLALDLGTTSFKAVVYDEQWPQAGRAARRPARPADRARGRARGHLGDRGAVATVADLLPAHRRAVRRCRSMGSRSRSSD